MSLIFKLIKDNWILMSVSALILLLYTVMGEAYEEKLASHRYVVGKGKSIILASSDDYGYFLILYQNSTNGGLLKAGYNVEVETISMPFSFLFFSFHSFTLKSIALICALSESFTHA